MSKMQNDIESFIRHLQSSLDKRKRHIQEVAMLCKTNKDMATGYYNLNMREGYTAFINAYKKRNEVLKQLHKEQTTETRMFKYFENARSFAKSLEGCK